MLSVTNQIGFGARRRSLGTALSVEYLDSQYTGSPHTTSESDTVSYGTAAAGSKIVIAACSQRGGGTVGSSSSLTANGNGFTKIVEAQSSGSPPNSFFGIWYFDDISGVIGGNLNTVINSSEIVVCHLAAWRIFGAAIGAPPADQYDTSTGLDPTDAFIDCPANSVVIAQGGSTFGDRTPVAWQDGADEDYELADGSQITSSGASRIYNTESLNQRVRVNFSSPTQPYVVAAAFSAA